MAPFSFPSVKGPSPLDRGGNRHIRRAHRTGFCRNYDCRSSVGRNAPRYGARLPETGDSGLDRTHTWGRTYWVGALYCLMGDVEIRKRTANTKGFRMLCERLIARAVRSRSIGLWISRSRSATGLSGGRTLAELYSKMAFQPIAIDLDHLWEQFGVRRSGRWIALNDHAPLWEIRGAICGTAKEPG